MNFKIVVLKICFFLIFNFSKAQVKNVAIGKWRVHSSLRNATCIEITPDRIYVGTQGGLFYIDKSTNEIKGISVTDGLSDLNISAIKYSNTHKTLVIAYETGAIDLIKENDKIIVINDVKNSNRSGSKRINDITLIKNFALLSCDFGGVLLDLIKSEIKESYLNIGKDGSTLSIFSAASKPDSLFLATSQGLLKSRFSNRNLMDFGTWTRENILGTTVTSAIHSIAVKNNYLLASINNKSTYSNKNGVWQEIFKNNSNLKLIEVNQEIYAISNNLLLNIKENLIDTLRGNFTFSPTDVAIEKDGKIYHSDLNSTLVKFNYQQSEKTNLNTSNTNSTFQLLNFEDAIFKMATGYDGLTDGIGKREGFSVLKGKDWFNFEPGDSEYNIPNKPDYSDAAYDKDRKLMYYSSVGSGVLIQNMDVSKPNEASRKMEIIDHKTESCKMFEQFTNGGPRTIAVTYSKEEDVVWVSAPVNDVCIYKIKPDKTCQYISFCGFIKSIKGNVLGSEQLNCRYPYKIIVDEYLNKWVQLSTDNQSGIIVFNEDEGVNSNNYPYKSVFLTTGVSNGDLPAQRVNCLTKDLKGDMWVGTSKGVTVFYNNGNFLDKYDKKNKNVTEITDSKVPRFEGFPLLFDVNIRAIEVDGANRKWIGTENGLYLMSEDGSRQIHFFNTSNSPLLSNVILNIKVNKKTSEVFINTDVGLFSYRGDATEGLETEPESIHIFPNPMKYSYEGLVGFTELGTSAKVKIIDMAGNLVYETTSNGGMATWNGRSTKGEKIAPGVYVVLTSKDDGEVAVSGKLFVTE